MELKGITWDHERGYNPLIPVSERFCAEHPGVSITWAKRSLKDFGDFPVSRLVDTYDLIMIDHPFMTEALKEKLLLVINDYLEPGYLEIQKKESLGLSLDSYCVNGLFQALPVDAATQVSAANMELMNERHAGIPKTLDEVFALKDKLGVYRIGTAMAATDIFSIYLGLVAQQTGTGYFDTETGVDPEAGERAALLLYKLAEISDPSSFEMNPIQLLDAMSNEGKIAYTPYIYGYTNYSRDGFRKRLLEFWDAPLINQRAEVSTQMGGVGISISSRIAPEKIRTAVEFAEYLASPDIQRGIYTKADGQPAALSAWSDKENNRITHGFFRNTAATLETSFIRPKVARWNSFQEEASVVLHSEIKEKKSATAVTSHFNELYREICAAK
ncbi:MAG: ABC transporter substrate-binding protein [Oscillospiraceae bacterium]|nr:ABC transporter substrate-binding protein [Oscillospiraceae bacterium]